MCPDGKLYKADVQKMYEKILPNTSSAKLFVDNIFRIFDADCDGHITFTVWQVEGGMVNGDPVSYLAQEFLVATDMTTAGSPEEKARWTFKMFDRDRCDVDIYVISTISSYIYNIYVISTISM